MDTRQPLKVARQRRQLRGALYWPLLVFAMLVSNSCWRVGGRARQTAPAASTSELRSEDAVEAILRITDSVPIVAIGDIHEVAELGAFRLRLLRDPRLPEHVQDIVIEGGNSLYQAVANRFVNGEPVSDDSLRLIWNNTTQSPFNTLDVPTYAEDVLRTVREVNGSLPASRRLRVLLADPPLEWRAIATRADLQGKTDRTGSHYRVLMDSVISRNRHALFFCGTVHLYKATAIGREAPAMRNVVQRILAARPRSVFVILVYDGFGGSAAFANSLFTKMTRGTLARIADGPLADLPVDQVFAATPGAPNTAPPAVIFLGADSAAMQGNFTGLRLGDIGDAYLFVGSVPELTLSRPNLQRYRDHPELLAELDRRQLIRTGTHFDTSAFFAVTPSPFATGWRADKNTRVPARRDARSEAIRAMARTLAAIGGEGRMAGLRTVARDGTRSMSDPGQGYRPQSSRVVSPPVLEKSRRAVLIDLVGGRSAITMRGTIFGGQPFSFRNVVDGQGSFAVNELKHTVTTSAAAPTSGAALSRLPRALPEVLLSQLWMQRDSLRIVGIESLEGRPHLILAASGAAASPRLFIDSATALPAKVESISVTPNGTDTLATEYSDWRTVNGLRFPFAQRDRRNGILVDAYVADSIEINRELPAQAFTRPADYALVPPANPRAPTMTKLADDVYLVSRGYNSIVVVFDSFVLFVDPALGNPASDAVRKLIADVAPGKPIRYVIATHFHSDHIGGASSFLKTGSTLVAGSHAIRAVRDAITRQESSGATAIPDSQFHVLTSTRTIADANHSVQIVDVGPNPHAEQMLVVYLPRQRLLFEADMLDLDVAPGLAAIGGDDTRALRTRLRELGLVVTTVVPAHGRVGTMADVDAGSRTP